MKANIADQAGDRKHCQKMLERLSTIEHFRDTTIEHFRDTDHYCKQKIPKQKLISTEMVISTLKLTLQIKTVTQTASKKTHSISKYVRLP